MNIQLKPNRSGYICNWLISGPATAGVEVDFSDPNQLKFEKDVRAVIADDNLQIPPVDILMGKEGLPGMPWRYDMAGNNWFIDTSAFYYQLAKVELYAYTELDCERDVSVNARLRTFAAVDLWLNRRHIAKNAVPVYKPIKNLNLVFDLKQGKNTVFIRMQNLGVRDTRNIVGLQLLGDLSGITVSLPDPQGAVAAVITADRWIQGVIYQTGKLVAEGAPPCDITVKVKEKVAGHEEATTGLENSTMVWVDNCHLAIPSAAQGVTLSAEVSGQCLNREIELIHNIKPEYDHPQFISIEEHRKSLIKKLADIKANDANGKIKDASYYVLARYICGGNTAEDDVLLMGDLDLIHQRIDCADFLLSAILRIFLTFRVENSAVQARMKEVCLDFRYWMDENGSDGMCFWSENHALLFYGNQMLAGQLYPDEIFRRSGRSGREQAMIGSARCREWLESIENTGFEEFLSGGYMCVTADALLNLIDFGPQDISERATQVLNRLLIQLSKHVYRGVVYGPQGRVYRDVIYPFKQGVQAMMYFINPDAPKGLSMWLADFGCTKYQIPGELVHWMNSPLEEVYPCGNAEINLKKTNDYLLASVNSPKNGKKGWSNEIDDTSNPYNGGSFSYAYTKVLNERFHGTTLFEPGVYGYQQHMGYAVLDNSVSVFVNHPGGTHDQSSMRPGYWYGNGLMPALKQTGNVLGLIYHLRDEHPVNFTHLYWPSRSFDSIVEWERWLFGKKGDSYIAVWCNVPYTPQNDMLFDCEYRAYAEKIAYVFYCSCAEESGSFQSFMELARGKSPRFSEASLKLTMTDGYELLFEEKHNDSQYI